MKFKVTKKVAAYILTFAFAAALLFFVLSGNIRFKTSENQQIKAQISTLQNQIDKLNFALQNINIKKPDVSLADVSALNEKVDQNQKTILEILSSKASMESAMGLSERIDRLETKTEALSEVTSQGALILTAAVLTNDAAKTGRPFIYEASVLQELSSGTRMQKSADIIASYALKGLKSEQDLIENFNSLYQKSFSLKQSVAEPLEKTEQDTSDWKEKFINKLKSLIVLKKIGQDKGAESKGVSNDEIFDLVQKGDFEKAIFKMDSDPKYRTEVFEIWIEEVRNLKNFNDQIQKIKALTLGVMRAQNLKRNISENN